MLADTLARTVIAPQQLPVGVLTALIGVPVFLFLLSRQPDEPAPALRPQAARGTSVAAALCAHSISTLPTGDASPSLAATGPGS